MEFTERQRCNFSNKVDKGGPDECWPWMGCTDERGYGRLKLTVGGVRMRRSHRVALLMIGVEIPEGMCVLHRCDNTTCVNPAHLFIGTHRDNMEDMSRKGRATKQCGVDTPWSKLDDDKVRAIRKRRKEGVPFNKIASEFGVTEGAIIPICNGRTWKHVK